MNENYSKPDLPIGVEQDILKGMYLFARKELEDPRGNVRLLCSDTLLSEVIEAADLLATDWNIGSQVWSVTSFTVSARDARDVERYNWLHAEQPARKSHRQASLYSDDAPVVECSDYCAGRASVKRPVMLMLTTRCSALMASAGAMPVRNCVAASRWIVNRAS